MEKEKKIYLYETHMHTKEGSACAHNTGAEMARISCFLLLRHMMIVTLFLFRKDDYESDITIF